jgi:hypothetical protein
MNLLTPSETVLLFADEFTDTLNSQDATNEHALVSGKKVNQERFYVALIRAAILANVEQGAIQINSQDSFAALHDLQQLTEPAGVGGKLIDLLAKSKLVHHALAEKTPYLRQGQALAKWPAGSLEAFIAHIAKSGEISTPDCVYKCEYEFANRRGIVRQIKICLVKRGLLEEYKRGFGLLENGYKLSESTKNTALKDKKSLKDSLEKSAMQQAELWQQLTNSVTNGLREGYSS